MGNFAQQIIKDYEKFIRRLNQQNLPENFVKSSPEGKANMLMKEVEDFVLLIKEENALFKEISSTVKKTKDKGLKRELKKIKQELSETSKHQIRKYYHRLLDIKGEMVGNDIKRFYPKIAMTSAFASYDKSRGNIGQAFKKFLTDLTKEAVKGDKNTFLELMTLFEAVVAYSVLHIEKN